VVLTFTFILPLDTALQIIPDGLGGAPFGVGVGA
jgi:hypothetical protein